MPVEQAVLTLINESRAEAGLEPLT
jgi:hypothetical protein